MRNKIGEQIKRDQAERKRQEKQKNEGKAYSPALAGAARGFILMGKNQQDIADAFGVAASTISRWKEQHPEFREAIEASKDMRCAELAGTAHLLATGQYVQEDSRLELDKKKGKLVVKTIRHKLPPSEQMLKFLLPKVAPENFAEKQELDLNVDGLSVELKVVGRDMG